MLAERESYTIAVSIPEWDVAPFSNGGWYHLPEHTSYEAARNQMQSMMAFLLETKGEAVLYQRVTNQFTGQTKSTIRRAHGENLDSLPSFEETQSLSAREFRSFDACARSYEIRHSSRAWVEFRSKLDEADLPAQVVQQIDAIAPPAPPKPAPPKPPSLLKRIPPVVRRRTATGLGIASIGSIIVGLGLTAMNAISPSLSAVPNVEELRVFRQGAFDLVKPDPNVRGMIVRIRQFPDGTSVVLDRYPDSKPQDEEPSVANEKRQGAINEMRSPTRSFRERDLSRLSPVQKGMATYLNGSGV